MAIKAASAPYCMRAWGLELCEVPRVGAVRWNQSIAWRVLSHSSSCSSWHKVSRAFDPMWRRDHSTDFNTADDCTSCCSLARKEDCRGYIADCQITHGARTEVKQDNWTYVQGTLIAKEGYDFHNSATSCHRSDFFYVSYEIYRCPLSSACCGCDLLWEAAKVTDHNVKGCWWRPVRLKNTFKLYLSVGLWAWFLYQQRK